MGEVKEVVEVGRAVESFRQYRLHSDPAVWFTNLGINTVLTDVIGWEWTPLTTRTSK